MSIEQVKRNKAAFVSAVKTLDFDAVLKHLEYDQTPNTILYACKVSPGASEADIVQFTPLTYLLSYLNEGMLCKRDYGKCMKVMRLLLDRGANLNVELHNTDHLKHYNFVLPLVSIPLNGFYAHLDQALGELINRGLSLTIPNGNGNNVLHEAAKHAAFKRIEWYLRIPEVREYFYPDKVNEKNAFGETPLDVFFKHIDPTHSDYSVIKSVKALIEFGVTTEVDYTQIFKKHFMDHLIPEISATFISNELQSEAVPKSHRVRL